MSYSFSSFEFQHAWKLGIHSETAFPYEPSHFWIVNRKINHFKIINKYQNERRNGFVFFSF